MDGAVRERFHRRFAAHALTGGLIRPALVIAGGLALLAAGFALLTRVDGDSSLATLVTGSVVFALGLAPVYTLAADMMAGSAPPERAGAAAGISETSLEFGGALGIAVLGAVGTAVYRGEIDSAVPTGIPPQAAEAVRDTLALRSRPATRSRVGWRPELADRRPASLHRGAPGGGYSQRRGRGRRGDPHRGTAPARAGWGRSSSRNGPRARPGAGGREAVLRQ